MGLDVRIIALSFLTDDGLQRLLAGKRLRERVPTPSLAGSAKC